MPAEALVEAHAHGRRDRMLAAVLGLDCFPLEERGPSTSTLLNR